MADATITPNLSPYSAVANVGPGFGELQSGTNPLMMGDAYGASFSAGMPAYGADMLAHGLASGGRAGMHNTPGNSLGVDMYGNPIPAYGVGGSTMAMAGQQMGPQEPTTFLGKLKKRYMDVQGYIYLPSLFLIVGSLMGKGDNNIMHRVTNNLGTQGLKGWQKPIFHVTKLVNKYDAGLWKWGGKVMDTVKNKWGLKLKPGGFVSNIYNGTSKFAGITLSGNATSRWGKVLNFIKMAGQPMRNAAPAVANAAGKIVTRLSLRSVLTGLGYAGPLGWITLAVTAGLTLFSLGKKLMGGGQNSAYAQQMAQQQAQQQAFLSGGNPYGNVPYAADTFGLTNPMANPLTNSLANPLANPTANYSANPLQSYNTNTTAMPTPEQAYYSLNQGGGNTGNPYADAYGLPPMNTGAQPGYGF